MILPDAIRHLRPQLRLVQRCSRRRRPGIGIVIDALRRALSGASRVHVLAAAVVVLALALRLAWIAYADFTPTLSDDAGRYDLLGRSLAEGGGYINPNGTTTMFWPPGYPFILAAVYKLWPAALLGDREVMAALALNAVFGAATVALVYALGRRAFDGRAALAGALLTALFPSLIFFAGVTLTETTFTFMALLALWLFVEAEARRAPRLLLAASVVVGFAALVRGQAALLPVVAVPFWLLSTRDLRATALRALAVAAIAALVVLPWTLRNYAESGSFVAISSNDGVNFYIGHSPGADGRGRKVDELVFRYPDLSQPRAEARISRDGFREGIEYAVEHPWREVELAFRKLWYLYYRDDEGLRWNDGHGERPFLSRTAFDALVALSNVYYAIVMALAAAGLAALALDRARSRGGATGRSPLTGPAVLLLSMLAYWTLVHIAFFADPRFHAPVMPIVALLAGVAISTIASSTMGRARER